MKSDLLITKLEKIIEKEDAALSEFATKSSRAIGHGCDKYSLRTPFGVDIDRIMHSPF